MNYELAVQHWGKWKLEQSHLRRNEWYKESKSPYYDEDALNIDVSTVVVDFVFDEGYACCGGSNPDCYCSYAESPKCEITIRGEARGRTYYDSVDPDQFHLPTIVQEIVEAGDKAEA